MNYIGKYGRSVTGLILLSSLVLATPASSSTVTNDFESYDFARDSANENVDQSFEGWTALAQVINLGVTEIAGCTTVDTSDYSNLRDLDTHIKATLTGGSTTLSSSTDPTSSDWMAVRADNDFFDHPEAFEPEEQLVYFQSAGFGTNATKHLTLENNVDSNTPVPVTLSGVDYGVEDGFIAHGPAVYSDQFNLSPSDTISFDWAADSAGDDFKAFGYLLNTSDCSQTELIDATGASSEWATVTRTGIASGTYRFVFIGGTYDKTWGGAAGGKMYLDNVVLPAFVPDTPATPPPYTGPKIQDVGNDSRGGAFTVSSSQQITVSGDRLSTVTKAFIDGKECEVVSTANDELVIITPAGLSAGVYDLVIYSSIGNLTHLDAVRVTAASVAAENYGEQKAWTQRISDTQAKIYVKYPVVGERVRIGVQTGGSGSYETIYVKTLDSESHEDLTVNANGSYIVRTIDLEDINRIRITVGDDRLVQVRYNQ